MANVMNLTIDVPAIEEGPSLGGAMLAAVGCGEYPNVEAAAEAIVKVTESLDPEPQLVAKYEEKYQKFRTLYPTLKDLF